MKTFSNKQKRFWFAVMIILLARAEKMFANPSGLSVGLGGATARQIGSQLNVSVSQLAILNWQSFNIGAGETTTFLQPSVNSIVFNEIGGANASQILGNLNANGTVILANANGFYFGNGSVIKVGGSFIATTAALPPDFGTAAGWQFTGMPPLASIVNYGQIQVGKGKSLFLIAEDIQNQGTLSAPAGNVDLAAGQSVLVSETPDGRGLSAAVTLPQGSVDNFGRITADAGTIALNAQVVNQNGALQADSVQNQNGEIELVASDTLNLGANSQILANGDTSTGGSAGGNVVLKSGNDFSDSIGSQISVTGGVNGGNGGNVEVSAPNIPAIHSTIDGAAQAGSTGGKLSIDPDYITLDDSGSDSAGSGTVTAGSNAGSTLDLDVNSAFSGFSDITLQAKYDITVADNTVWDLSGSTGNTTGLVTLLAGRNIIFGDGAQITDENNWSVTLEAGYDFAAGKVEPNAGSIYLGDFDGSNPLSNSGTIQLTSGSINLIAGQDILVGSGSVSTTGGGSIFANALSGNINAGTDNGSADGQQQSTDYDFTDSGWTPNPYLGGISTAAGGNVTLIAGNNIDSTPTVPSRQAPGASGAYGSGDVTVIAGNQITGNYLVTDGTGRMIAGVPVSAAQAAILQDSTANQATTLNDLVTAVEQSQNSGGNVGSAPVNGNPSTAPVTLGLTSGSWNVWAANDVSIKQIVNPNGAFNSSQFYAYNYAPDASVNFWAGNAIELVGSSYGSTPSSVRQAPIYAPSLSLDAGAGGIIIDKGIILAPSLYTDPVTSETYSEGSLSIITRDGGNLTGAVTAGSTVLNGITMSDSASSAYTTFGSEHDNIHLYDPNPQPVYLDISGSIGSFNLAVPTFADITVESTAPVVTSDGTSVYGTYNFGFNGRNLSASQTTSINVLGEITYRGAVTAINLTTAELADPLPAQLFSDSSDTFITSKLTFDATSGKLSYVGVMSSDDLQFLLNPTVIVLDSNGKPVLQPVLDANGNPVLDANGNEEFAPETRALTLDATQQAAITQLYTASQSATLGDQGIALTGPGTFNVAANSLDLGVSGGISVLAPDAGLAAISPYGANLNVTTIGDLSMTSTRISNESYLGNINVTVGGTLDVGDQLTSLGNAGAAEGIYSSSGGNVSVTASGDVNVDGSRIAAYDGGNINVTSQNGDVNAGTGGAGYVSMTVLQLNSAGQLVDLSASIPGSGILATTISGSSAALGNISVEAPNGNINASAGGILQLGFNGRGPSDAFVSAVAGKDINATGSGIIGSNLRLQAGGNINGLVIGSQSVAINSLQNVNVTAVSGGNVDVTASGTVSGTIVGGGDVSVSGDSIDASVRGGSVATSGDTSGASLGIPASNVATENAQVADNATTATSKTDDNSDDDMKKKKKPVTLAQKVSRVTVLLPKKD